MTASSSEFEGYLKAAARASSLVTLVEVSFLALEARLNMVPPNEETEKLSWNVKRCEGRWFREDAGLRVLMPYVVDISAKTTNGGRLLDVAHLAVTIRIAYELKDPTIDNETLHGYATITPLMHTWPYLRAEIQTLTAKLDLPPLLLPAIVSGNAEDRVHMVHVTPGQLPTPEPTPKKVRRPKRAPKRLRS
jgi:hypothetical protein